jgi:uncharacterized protein YwgA
MDAEDIVLGVVSAAGGEITCRTYLQKVAYFVSEKMGIPMGFGPHYYGPYSSSITAETDSQVAMGRLAEIRGSGGQSRVFYRYGLKQAGEEYLKAITDFDPEGFQQLTGIVTKIQATGADYNQLACAAKLHFLLQEAGGKISRATAKNEARRLGWRIEDEDIDTAIRVLQQLDLAE